MGAFGRAVSCSGRMIFSGRFSVRFSGRLSGKEGAEFGDVSAIAGEAIASKSKSLEMLNVGCRIGPFPASYRIPSLIAVIGT